MIKLNLNFAVVPNISINYYSRLIRPVLFTPKIDFIARHSNFIMLLGSFDSYIFSMEYFDIVKARPVTVDWDNRLIDYFEVVIFVFINLVEFAEELRIIFATSDNLVIKEFIILQFESFVIMVDLKVAILVEIVSSFLVQFQN